MGCQDGMRPVGGSGRRHPSYVESLTMVQLTWDTTGPGGLGPAHPADPPSIRPLRTRGVPSGSSRGGRSDRRGSRGLRPVAPDRLPTRPRCAAPVRHAFPGGQGRLAPTQPKRPSPRPAPVPAGMGAGAGRGRPASPATDRRGLALSLDISHPEWDRPGRLGTRRGPAPARGPSAGGPRPTPHERGRPAAAGGGGWRGSVAACGRGGPAAQPRRRPPRRRPGPLRRSRRAGTRAGLLGAPGRARDRGGPAARGDGVPGRHPVDLGVEGPLGRVGPTRANMSGRSHRLVARFPARRRGRSHESPGCRISRENLNSRRVCETRIGLPGRLDHRRPAGLIKGPILRDGRAMDSSPGGTFLRPIGVTIIPRTCRKPSRCNTYII